MDVLVYLLPIALLLGILSLAAFFWALHSGQFDDPIGSANRILLDDAPRQDEKTNEPSTAPSETIETQE